MAEFGIIEKLNRRAVFREVNEQIREINERFWLRDGTLDLFCECGEEDCTRRVEVPPPVYAGVRSDESAFVVAAGHEQPDRDSVSSEGLTYRVIVAREERLHRTAPLVAATDPLSG